mgnify:CR=1 FL=1
MGPWLTIWRFIVHWCTEFQFSLTQTDSNCGCWSVKLYRAQCTMYSKLYLKQLNVYWSWLCANTFSNLDSIYKCFAIYELLAGLLINQHHDGFIDHKWWGWQGSCVILCHTSCCLAQLEIMKTEGGGGAPYPFNQKWIDKHSPNHPKNRKGYQQITCSMG